MSHGRAIRNNRKLSWLATGIATTPVRSPADIALFFDHCASSGFSEPHGDPGRLLAYRLGLTRAHARIRPSDVVLDVGCGNGHHLIALAPEIARGVGVDLSPGMIDLARSRLRGSAWTHRLAFEVDNAEALAGIATASVDLVLCIGAFEHMIDKPAVLSSIHRVLKAGGRFFCMTPDGSHIWYRVLAPLLGFATKHLSTDRFVTRRELAALLAGAGFRRAELGWWTFTPNGDMPPLASTIVRGLGVFGHATRLGWLCGGLWACARKDSDPG